MAELAGVEFKGKMASPLTYYSENRDKLIVSDESLNFIKDNYNWKKVLSCLVDYVKRFNYDMEKKQWMVATDETN